MTATAGGTIMMERAALQLAQRGWPVFPIYGITDGGRCSCPRGEGCPSPGKHPMLPDWPNRASPDVAIIRSWRWLGANLGICTGERSGLLVLDIDPRNGGDRALAALSAQLGPVPETLTARTGGGGRHYLYRYPEPVLSRTLVPGVDVKASKGYIVAPPSRHASVQQYEWLSTAPIAALPSQWLTRLQGSERSNGSRPTADPIPDELIEGMRNETLASLAGSLRRRGLGVPEILAALQSVSQSRCRPPLDDDELNWTLAQLLREAAGEWLARHDKEAR